MATTYRASYIESSNVHLAWAAFRARLEARGEVGSRTLYAKPNFEIDDERVLSPEEGLRGGDFDIENNLVVDDQYVSAYRVIDDEGQTIGWLFAGLVAA